MVLSIYCGTSYLVVSLLVTLNLIGFWCYQLDSMKFFISRLHFSIPLSPVVGSTCAVHTLSNPTWRPLPSLCFWHLTSLVSSGTLNSCLKVFGMLQKGSLQRISWGCTDSGFFWIRGCIQTTVFIFFKKWISCQLLKSGRYHIKIWIFHSSWKMRESGYFGPTFRYDSN